MRYFLVFLPLLAAGCADTYGSGYASDAGGYHSPRYASGYGSNDRDNDGYYGRSANYSGGENCGTPGEPRACPPMPRRPLPYYPEGRW